MNCTAGNVAIQFVKLSNTVGVHALRKFRQGEQIMNLSQNDIPLSEAVRRILHRKRLVAMFFAVGAVVGSVNGRGDGHFTLDCLAHAGQRLQFC